jgi:inosine/xanthosine triphosphatase
MKILVGSKNPVKIEAVKEAFSKYFDKINVVGIEVSADVPAQPINDQTFDGAQNRALTLQAVSNAKNLDADFFVGIEGGIQKNFDRWFAFGCMCIIDKKGNTSFGTSPHFELPENVIQQLLKGIELGNVMDKIMNTKNSKQNHGAIGFFTNGAMNRKELYVPGLIAALVPFNHKEMYFKPHSKP